MSKRAKWSVLTVGAVLACAAGFTVGAPSPATAAAPMSVVAAQLMSGGAPVVSADRAQQNSFAVTRRPSRSDDALSPGAAAVLSRGPREELGVNPALARRAGRASGAPVWLAPGRGWMCLASERGTGACNRTDQALAGYLLGVERLDAQTVRISGAVPDGASSVQIIRADGPALLAVAQDNVYVVDVQGSPTEVRFTAAGEERTVAVMAP